MVLQSMVDLFFHWESSYPTMMAMMH